MKFNFQSLSLLPISLAALSIITPVQAQGLGPFLCALFEEDLPTPYCKLVAACENAPNNTVSWSPDSMFTDLTIPGNGNSIR
jgi:hypothetical protein